MKTEKIEKGYCIQSGDKFVNTWYEPQFSSFCLGGFDGVCVFKRIEEAEKIQSIYLCNFPDAEIKKVRVKRTIELI